MKNIALGISLLCASGLANSATLYAMNQSSISKIDTVTGVATYLSAFDTNSFDGALAYGDGTLYAMNQSSISVIDTVTGT